MRKNLLLIGLVMYRKNFIKYYELMKCYTTEELSNQNPSERVSGKGGGSN